MEKKRNLLLKGILVYFFIAGLTSAIAFLILGASTHQLLQNAQEQAHNQTPIPSVEYFYYVGGYGLLCFIFSIALFQWKKWGFWGLAGTLIFGTIAATVYPWGYLDLHGLVKGLLHLLLLYFAITLGGKGKNAWAHLT